ncbi:hypothetical protein FRC07_005500 [Ceratobasidium sp. 392]|nr:hypothetical protein FRC07_005500 [Ceratobasidium sp. 392]
MSPPAMDTTQGPTPDNSQTQATPGNASTSSASISLTPDQLSAMISSAVQATVTQVMQNVNPLRQRSLSEVDSRKAKMLLSSASSLPKLKDGTYLQWSFAVSDTVWSAGLLGHLDGTLKRPDRTNAHVQEKWDQEDAAVCVAIVGALDHNMVYCYLEGTKTAKEAWDALKRHWKTNDTASLMAIDKELGNLRMSKGGGVVEHIANLRRLKR